MMLNKGELDGVRLLSPTTVRLMTSNQTGDVNSGAGKGYKFGLGFEVIEDTQHTGDVRSVGTFHWGGYWHTNFWIDPVEELVAVKMAQIIPADHLNDNELFRTLTYQAIVE